MGLIVFSPLICLFACIATGYSRYKEYQKELRVKLNIRVCDRSGVMNDCPICFAEFEEKEKVCELECPGKHIYHEDCIRTWIKVQKSCPTCRYNLVGDISNWFIIPVMDFYWGKVDIALLSVDNIGYDRTLSIYHNWFMISGKEFKDRIFHASIFNTAFDVEYTSTSTNSI